MPKKLEKSPGEWSAPNTGRETITLHLKTITPMFGGGHTAREIDEEMPVRPAAIRGALRFWWRATVGAKFSSVEALYKAESRLWGRDTDDKNPGHSRVSLSIQIIDPGTVHPHHKIAPRATREHGPRVGYFLFPFQKERERAEASGRKDIKFKLHITFAEGQREDIEKAIRAWLFFGGIGARTRRGCGALQCDKAENINDVVPETVQNIEAFLSQLALSPPQQVPWMQLHGGLIFLKPPTHPNKQWKAKSAWQELGTMWARFRKGHVPPSWSYKPAEEGKWHDYPRLVAARGRTGGSIALGKAFLGLPIEYQSYGPSIKNSGSGRMASPVILKPVIFKNGAIYPMVAILDAKPPSEVTVDGRVFSLSIPTISSEPVYSTLRVPDSLKALSTYLQHTQIWDVSPIRIQGARP
jgi:CRISPR-associated protein Cmr1